MTRERAFINALEIIDTCRTYSNEDKCEQCPYNVKGCIVTEDGNEIPRFWRASNIIKTSELKGE